MKFIRYLHRSPDIVLSLSIGALALLSAFIPQLAIARMIFGFTFVFLGSGYPVTSLLPTTASLLERIITASTLSLLMTYPASVLTVITEGQDAQAIFGAHLTNSLSILFLLSIALTYFVSRKQRKKPRLENFPKILLIPLLIYGLLVFTNLNRADVFGDEYDLGYQAYNLVDGIVAGRKAYLLSLNQHPPLAINIKHFSMNILEPSGLDNIKDWQFRVSEAITGLLVIIAAYALAKELFSEKAAVTTAVLLSVNNYMVWMGRIFHREMYLTFFMTAGLLFYIRAARKRNQLYSLLAGLGFGAALLVKETGLVILSVPLFDLLLSPSRRKLAKAVLFKTFVLFLPVIIYNIAAYAMTGYADVFFSNLFGIPHPLTTPRSTIPFKNILSLISYLYDIYSPVVFAVFLLGTAVAAIKKSIHPAITLWLLTSILFFAVTSVRAYYFVFLTVPLAILAAQQIVRLQNKMLYTLVTILLGYSLFYSVNTNLTRGFSRAESIGRIDGGIIISHPITQHYSLAARSWEEEVGYKRLQAFLDEKIEKRDCLIVSESMNPLAVRRYLGLRDAVKEHYLGPNYLSRYPRCPRDTRQVLGTVHLVSGKKTEVGELIMVITDHLGNERFYLYMLPKGYYA